MARKTIIVDDLRLQINAMLMGPIKPACKAILCSLLENVLQDTGNYHGFGWPKLTTAEAKAVTSSDPEYYTRRYYRG